VPAFDTAPALPAGYEVLAKLGEGGMGAVWRVRGRLLGSDYAVKSTLRRDPDDRLDFLRELITWMALPEHPCVLGCRFFRTVDDRVLVFSDLAEGGSLADALAGGRVASLADALDAAIQLAWGLEVVHAQGWVHQDVKPQNALYTSDGALKVSDFGLARSSGGAAWAGATPAYASPEQAQALAGQPRPLTRATDVWSWGACVLELLVGERTWAVGPAAAAALQAMIHGAIPCRVGAFPRVVETVLRRALAMDPQARWSSMAEPVELLGEAYREVAGTDYPRLRIPPPRDPVDSVPVETWRTWREPVAVVREALAATGGDPARAEALVLPSRGSRRLRMLGDLYGYELAAAIHLGARAPSPAAAGMLWGKALLHAELHDTEGALACWTKAVELWAVLPEGGDQRAHALANGAALLESLGRLRDAREWTAAALAHYADRQRRRGGIDETRDFARTLVQQATLDRDLGMLDDTGLARALDRAIALLEPLVARTRSARETAELARLEVRRAALSDGAGALALLHRAVAHLRGLGRSHRTDLAGALVLLAATDDAIARPSLDEAVALHEQLLEESGEVHNAAGYASALIRRASVLAGQAGPEAARAPLQSAITFLEHRVHGEGRLDVLDYLLTAYEKMAALAAIVDGDAAASLDWNVRSAQLRERALALRWDPEEAGRLGSACREAGVDASVLGRFAESRAWFERARAAFTRAGLDDELPRCDEAEAEARAREDQVASSQTYPRGEDDPALELLRGYAASVAGAAPAVVQGIADHAEDIADDFIRSGRHDLYRRAEPLLDAIRRAAHRRRSSRPREDR
jgi:tetratricopeptide (TPR) repeat protein